MSSEENIRKMGIELIYRQEQIVFEKINEARLEVGVGVYIHKGELIQDLKKLEEYEKIKQENEKQKEIIDIFKKAYEKKVFWIEKEETKNVEEYIIHDGVSNGISITQEQFNLLKEWLDND